MTPQHDQTPQPKTRTPLTDAVEYGLGAYSARLYPPAKEKLLLHGRDLERSLYRAITELSTYVLGEGEKEELEQRLAQAEAARQTAERERDAMAADFSTLKGWFNENQSQLSTATATIAILERERDEANSLNLVLQTRLGQEPEPIYGEVAVQGLEALNSLRNNKEWNEWVGRIYSEPRYNSPHRISHVRALEMCALLFTERDALKQERDEARNAKTDNLWEQWEIDRAKVLAELADWTGKLAQAQKDRDILRTERDVARAALTRIASSSDSTECRNIARAALSQPDTTP